MTAPAGCAVTMCVHTPPCPPATAPDHAAAVVVARDPAVGCTRLCNGVIMFDDTGELLPDRTPIPTHRAAAPHTVPRQLTTSP